MYAYLFSPISATYPDHFHFPYLYIIINKNTVFIIIIIIIKTIFTSPVAMKERPNAILRTSVHFGRVQELID
jgi:hypothetical protein